VITGVEKGPSAAVPTLPPASASEWVGPAAGTSPPQSPLHRAPCTWTLLNTLSATVTDNGLPEAVRSVMMRSGKTATSARGGALRVRRTSDARSNAAGAHQGLLNAPGMHGRGV